MEPDRRYPLNLPTFLPATPAEHQRNLVELERWANTLPLNPRVSEALYGDTTGIRPPWNLPWGTVAYAETTTSQNTITTLVDLTGLSVTWAALTGRRYRITLFAEVNGTAAGDLGVAYITTDANVEVRRHVFTVPALVGGVGYSAIQTSRVESGLSGSVTRKARLQRNSGAGSVSLFASATTPAHLIVEDIGPSTATPPTA